MEIFIFVATCLVSVVFLVFTAQAFQRERGISPATFAVCALIVFLAGLPPVQAFVKTWLISEVNKRFVELGEKLDEVQKVISKMEGDLRGEQRKLVEVQTSITAAMGELRGQQLTNRDVQNTLLLIQDKVSSGQIALAKQAEQLSDIRYWVDNLFVNAEMEEFRLNDTNRVVKTVQGDRQYYVFRLKAAAVTNSLQITLKGHGPNLVEVSLPIQNADRNLVVCGLYEYDDARTSIAIRYFRDSRVTNIFNRIESRDGRLHLDGVPANIK